MYVEYLSDLENIIGHSFSHKFLITVDIFYFFLSQSWFHFLNVFIYI